MDKLANYGSDDDYEESPKHEKMEYHDKHKGSHENNPKAPDTNYDEVGMELSEDSDGSNRSDSCRAKSDATKTSERDRNKKYDSKDSSKSSSKSRNRNEDDYRSKDKYDREYDRTEQRDESKYKDREDRHRNRDRERDRDDTREKDRYRDDRRSRRSTSRERYRSRSPTGRRGRRSNSRERERTSKHGYSRRYDKYDKASNKMAHLEKMGIEIKTPENQYSSEKKDDQKTNASNENKFFLPGVTGRLREQMERRKLLWQKRGPEKINISVVPAPSTSTSKAGSKVWEETTFAQDQDGKQASKFKRLMGIKDTSLDGSKPTSDSAKKQEELFSTMEQQYEVARTATHTMRGVGLGFGSYQR